ncbi:MAG: toxin-antitoxin system HicB family antitoxin [Planctomycetaceae bacterium]|nr:toxin-antitoxin system HicB family antitoxin [Planctomycetaceae bacterium]
MFDQKSGVIATAFPSEIERDAFFDSPQYNEVMAIQAELMKKTGLRKGSTPRLPEKSGRFNVRVPKSLHEILEVEAKRENVSLNQLAVAKLAMPLQSRIGGDLVSVVRAFADVHDGFAIDRIIVDPDYNPKFLRRCAELGLKQPPIVLNQALMNVRKSKKQRERLGIQIPPTTRPTEFRDFDDYQFASEIAIRVLQRTEGVTLDRVLCDPGLLEEFDRIALEIVNQTRLKLRWAALNLRKTRLLRPIKDLPSAYDLVSIGPFRSVNLDSVADVPGLYAIYDHSRPIYAGETSRLRHRIALHQQYGIPWIDLKDESMTVKAFAAPGATQSQREKWLMAFVNAEHPLLNYQHQAAA